MCCSGRLEEKKNWPKCCPITNMDIAGEVPEGLQSVVTCAYWSYLVPPLPSPSPDTSINLSAVLITRFTAPLDGETCSIASLFQREAEKGTCAPSDPWG